MCFAQTGMIVVLLDFSSFQKKENLLPYLYNIKGRTFKNLHQAWRSPGEAAQGDHASEEVLTLKTQCSPRLSIARVGEREWSPALTFSISAQLSTYISHWKRAGNPSLFTSAVIIMASCINPIATSRASPVSILDKEVLLELIKDHTEVLNDKSMKFYASIKKEQVGRRLPASFVT